jgi:predicted  nucleic acid-binding Zn-ribbon protein
VARNLLVLAKTPKHRRKSGKLVGPGAAKINATAIKTRQAIQSKRPPPAFALSKPRLHTLKEDLDKEKAQVEELRTEIENMQALHQVKQDELQTSSEFFLFCFFHHSIFSFLRIYDSEPFLDVSLLCKLCFNNFCSRTVASLTTEKSKVSNDLTKLVSQYRTTQQKTVELETKVKTLEDQITSLQVDRKQIQHTLDLYRDDLANSMEREMVVRDQLSGKIESFNSVSTELEKLKTVRIGKHLQYLFFLRQILELDQTLILVRCITYFCWHSHLLTSKQNCNEAMKWKASSNCKSHL